MVQDSKNNQQTSPITTLHYMHHSSVAFRKKRLPTVLVTEIESMIEHFSIKKDRNNSSKNNRYSQKRLIMNGWELISQLDVNDPRG